MAAPISELLSLEATCASTNLSKASIYAAMKRGDFPRPIRLCARRVAWRIADINKWIDTRPTTTNASAFARVREAA